MAYTIQNKEYTTVYELIKDYALEVFQMIYEEHQNITDDKMYEEARDSMCNGYEFDFNDIAEEFAVCVEDKQGHVSQYGMYAAIQLYNRVDDSNELFGCDEEEFYGKLIYVILTSSDESINALSYDRYKEFVKNQK